MTSTRRYDELSSSDRTGPVGRAHGMTERSCAWPRWQRRATRRPDHGPYAPYSLRRPVDDVLDLGPVAGG
jgi:hypothetical protein